jgi:RNA 2',3'-cyclic 3'-phosphodiesterase
MRLFLALWPDAPTRDAISAWQREWDWPPAAAPVAPERLHLTLHFIGNVPGKRLRQVIAGLKVAFEPMDFSLNRADVWPNSIAVVQPTRTRREMIELHRSLADALRGLELPVESRPFRPHVTLARRARGAMPPSQEVRVRWQASDGYVLVESMPGGAGYRIVERFAN